jgi:hypothetical protein
MIEIRHTGALENSTAPKVKFNIKLPDANSLSTLLLDWDQDKLNALPLQKQKEILATLDNLRRSGKLKFIEGEEELTLVKENGLWRVLFDWAAGLRVIRCHRAITKSGHAAQPRPACAQRAVHHA